MQHLPSAGSHNDFVSAARSIPYKNHDSYSLAASPIDFVLEDGTVRVAQDLLSRLNFLSQTFGCDDEIIRAAKGT
jgi:hypothetical protein